MHTSTLSTGSDISLDNQIAYSVHVYNSYVVSGEEDHAVQLRAERAGERLAKVSQASYSPVAMSEDSRQFPSPEALSQGE